jgi:hypothetical protein
MEAKGASEVSLNCYQSTRRYNPENSQLHIRRHENLKAHFIQVRSDQYGNYLS